MKSWLCSETKFRPNCEQYILADTQINSLPLGITSARLYELFEVSPQNQNGCFPLNYHVQLKVSDSEVTSNTPDWANPVLYVSSSDDMLQNIVDKMDFSQSYAEVAFNDSIGSNVFGTSRGLGKECCSIGGENGNTWYGYDEFITNGGFEVVTATLAERYFNHEADQETRTVPVQSCADVIIIDGEGANKAGGPVSGIFNFTYPSYDNDFMSNPDHAREWNSNSGLFLAFDINGDLFFNAGWCPLPNDYCNRYSDFKTKSAGYHNYGWGDFWLKKNNELRWLVILGCEALSNLGNSGEQPDQTWKDVIADNYLNSVCGFNKTIRPPQFEETPGQEYFLENGLLVSTYGSNLSVIYLNITNGEFVTDEKISVEQQFWYGCDNEGCDVENDHRSRDLSVAAWMEAVCELVGYPVGRDKYSVSRLKYAKAIDYDHEDERMYYWMLELINDDDEIDEYEVNNITYDMKIHRYHL